MNSEPHATSETLDHLLRTRRTIHLFRPELPPEDLVLNALESARWAPNHHHTEPWRFTLLGPESIQQVVNLNAELVTAKKGTEAGEAKRKRWSEIPGWLLVTCKKSDDNFQQQEDYAACCCAIHNFSLSLWAAGIGVKWTTGAVTRDAQFYELMNIDNTTEETVGLLWYGYPQQIPDQKRMPVEQVLRKLP